MDINKLPINCPKRQKIHLCDTCYNEYPCMVSLNDVVFDIDNINVIKCKMYME